MEIPARIHGFGRPLFWIDRQGSLNGAKNVGIEERHILCGSSRPALKCSSRAILS